MPRTLRHVAVRLRQRLARVMGRDAAEDPTMLVYSDSRYRPLLDPSVLLHNAKLGGANQIGPRSALIGTHADSVVLGYASMIGANSVISGEVEIGRYCQMGAGVAIHSRYHPMNRASIYIHEQFLGGVVGRDEPCERVVVGNDVWVGDQAIILKGVTVGSGAVIGAGSIVTKDVPDYAVVAGNPARLIRMRFSEAVIERLLRLQWWELDLGEVERIRGLFDVDLTGDETTALSALDAALSELGRAAGTTTPPTLQPAVEATQ